MTDPNEPVYRCYRCRDTQWKEYRCDGGGTRMCGRGPILAWYEDNGRSYALGSCKTPHFYVDRCFCWRHAA